MSFNKPPLEQSQPFEPRIFVAVEARPEIDFEGDLPPYLAALADQLSDDAKHLNSIYRGDQSVAASATDRISLTDVAASALAYSAQSLGEHSLSSRSSAVMANIIAQAEQLATDPQRANLRNRFVGYSMRSRSLIASLVFLAVGVWAGQSLLHRSSERQIEHADSLAQASIEPSAAQLAGTVGPASDSTNLHTSVSDSETAPHNLLEGLSASEQEGVLDLLEQQASRPPGLSI